MYVLHVLHRRSYKLLLHVRFRRASVQLVQGNDGQSEPQNHIAARHLLRAGAKDMARSGRERGPFEPSDSGGADKSWWGARTARRPKGHRRRCVPFSARGGAAEFLAFCCAWLFARPRAAAGSCFMSVLSERTQKLALFDTYIASPGIQATPTPRPWKCTNPRTRM